MLRELRLDVLAGLGAVLARVGAAGEAARVHHGRGAGRPPGVVLE